jgi:hypothetical protein
LNKLLDFYINDMKYNPEEFKNAKVGQVENLTYLTTIGMKTVWRLKVEVGRGTWSKEFDSKELALTHRAAILGAIEECKQLGMKSKKN